MTHPAQDTDRDLPPFDPSKLDAMLEAIGRAGRTLRDQRRLLLDAKHTIARLEDEKRGLEAEVRRLADRAALPMAIVQTAVTRSDALTDEAIAAMVRDVDGSFAHVATSH